MNYNTYDQYGAVVELMKAMPSYIGIVAIYEVIAAKRPQRKRYKLRRLRKSTKIGKISETIISRRELENFLVYFEGTCLIRTTQQKPIDNDRRETRFAKFEISIK
ncbi:hypothetical protein LCGC14_0195610 [marine sediment metagenome]|uniref:Uncharacterized protein n=1 Tax=marine sediment metagenome TaxID=412755 RepID=A0A0F9XNE4_9ZZZZ